LENKDGVDAPPSQHGNNNKTESLNQKEVNHAIPGKGNIELFPLIRGKEEREPVWDFVEEHADNVTSSSFCHTWSVNSDEWWTHHPDWEIFQETDDGYCFRLIQDKGKAEFMRKLYKNQYQGNCSNIFPVKMWSSGFGADMTNLKRALSHSLYAGRPMEVTTYPWHYAAPDEANKGNKVRSKPACPLLTMYCYFLKLSSCEQAAPGVLPEPEWVKGELFVPHDHDPWLEEYMARPQTWLRHEVYMFVKNQTIQQPCTVIHVRRSDVIDHNAESRKYHAISEYINASAKIQIQPNILLLTDDQNAVGEAKTVFPEYHWMVLDRPRWKALEGGFERQLPSSDPIFEMKVLLSTFRLIRKCQSLVHTKSNLGSLFKYELLKANNSAQVYNLDYGKSFKEIHNTKNKRTWALSVFPQKV
jgi:hypothetical protein